MKLIIAILLLVIGTFAQNTTYKDGTDCECDSIRSDYYESGELRAEVPYINGNTHGLKKMYYITGNIWMEDPYINGKRNGIYKLYYGNGMLSMETSYINGNIHGVVKSYYESGALIYYTNDIQHGTEKWYYESGALAGTATYKNGKLVGYKKCTDGRFGNERLNCLK